MSMRNAYRLAPVILAVMYLSSCGGPSVKASYKMEASTLIGPPCEHVNMPYSEYVCLALAESSQFRPADVAAETLVVHTTDSRNIRIALPNRTDGLFLSESAIETFLLRHYDATDTSKARRLRQYLDSAYHH